MVIDFDRFESLLGSVDAALEKMSEQEGVYDPSILTLLKRALDEEPVKTLCRFH